MCKIEDLQIAGGGSTILKKNQNDSILSALTGCEGIIATLKSSLAKCLGNIVVGQLWFSFIKCTEGLFDEIQPVQSLSKITSALYNCVVITATAIHCDFLPYFFPQVSK